MFERAILHLDLDAFFVSVERLHNTALQGKPLIIGGSRGWGVVASCSYEARAFGIHGGTNAFKLLRLYDRSVKFASPTLAMMTTCGIGPFIEELLARDTIRSTRVKIFLKASNSNGF